MKTALSIQAKPDAVGTSFAECLKRGLANGLILSSWCLAFGFGSHAGEWWFYFSH